MLPSPVRGQVLFGIGLVTGILATVVGDKSAVIIMFYISVSVSPALGEQWAPEWEALCFCG